MNTYQPTDAQIEALARDDYGVAAPLMGVTIKFEDWDGRDRHRVAIVGLVGTPAFQSIIRAAQAEAWKRGYTSGHSRAMRRMSDEPNVAPAPNPYLEESA